MLVHADHSLTHSTATGRHAYSAMEVMDERSLTVPKAEGEQSQLWIVADVSSARSCKSFGPALLVVSFSSIHPFHAMQATCRDETFWLLLVVKRGLLRRTAALDYIGRGLSRASTCEYVMDSLQHLGFFP